MKRITNLVFIILSCLGMVACTSQDVDLGTLDKNDGRTLPLAIDVSLPLIDDEVTRGFPTTFYQTLDTICDSMQIAFVACGVGGDTTYYGNGNNYCVYTYSDPRKMWIPDDPIVIGTPTAYLYPYYPYFIKLAYHYDFSHTHQTSGATTPPSVIDSIRAKMFMPVKFDRLDGIYRQVDYMYGRTVAAGTTDPYENNSKITTSVSTAGTGGYANVHVTMLHAQAAIFICLSIPQAYYSSPTKIGKVQEVQIGDIDRDTPAPGYTARNKIFVCGDLHFDIMNGMITRLDSSATLTWTRDTILKTPDPTKGESWATWNVDTAVYSTFIVPKVIEHGDFSGWQSTSGYVGGSATDPDIRISVKVDGTTYVSPKLKNKEWLPGRKYYYYLSLSNSISVDEVTAPLNVNPFSVSFKYGDRGSTGNDADGIYADF